ncbi:MAG TPA: Re/Si-specific NAD(P)(+) transhydrogenase subunit alpha [Deltaproteobacteria bacterium]|nr:MAG: NAD(P) transhydrogenase subunit alpha [Deltaproteobacteria bacterium GWA2_55_82]OGQ63994.1 MAG: NAD(P) transhydrogenase subunit alpha [Deltaproteobacteria bacterium RIFCSPLOWO2_02_FULL_55_12]OIJ73427.1 MAG: NAD(P) transhydrogenase subunit alpha [Deltaproteobacteria bacterium GWC2_55_46]HBG47290.1 Re/Si-specific NAD(P)(+) transhydrogenase subunit alpha [Deltaproteobacteria bacterium]HCY10056.1 Re/Si-specific NAD(P)(+) transhydrogenase subunit alpha [Deltaproteobacteria bacterium]
MRIGIPREIHEGEKRVATTPDVAEKLQKLGFTVAVESGAGAAANFSDEAYREAGVEVIADAKTLWASSDIIFKVRAPETHPELAVDEVSLLKEGATLVSFIWPGQNSTLMGRLADRKVNVIAMDSVPRVSRAQKLDALSSMANIAGYRAVIEAAHHFGRFFTGQITAAGKVPPAKVMVIGAGVAGLAALGAANGLGAIVRAFDTRPEVKDQVKSMGAEFLELDFKEDGSGEGGYAKVMSPEFIKAEMELFARQAMEVDIIITTALIPGKPAPKLILEGMVESMKPGSVIVDLASEQGGNCALTEPGKVVVKYGVTIIGYTDLPSRLSRQASQLYATNLLRLTEELSPKKDGTIDINMEDEVIRGATVIKEGAITWPPPAPKLSGPKKLATAAPPVVKEPEKPAASSGVKTAVALVVGALLLLGLGAVAPPAFMAHFTVFVLACFVGYQVIWNVTPALHTPLMSVTNAISGIIVIGAILQVAAPTTFIMVLAGLAILIASVNIAGGFLVTQRMLRMFSK